VCAEAVEGQIYGYVVFEYRPELVIHFCYVKQPFRRFGLAKRLIDEVAFGEGRKATDCLWCSHVPTNREIWDRLKDRYSAAFNPRLRERDDKRGVFEIG